MRQRFASRGGDERPPAAPANVHLVQGIIMKKCGKCAELKAINRFSKDKSKHDGLCTVCKDCRVKYRKSYYEANKDKAIADSRSWYEENKDQAAEKKAIYYRKNIDLFRAKRKAKYWQDPQSAKDSVKAYNRERARVDPVFRMAQRCRKRLWAALKEGGYTKRSRSFEIIGCSPEQLMSHLASMFSAGMTEENYGQWHIDHIIPLASAGSEDEVIRLCHYTNLQPLWAEDNIRKGAKIL